MQTFHPSPGRRDSGEPGDGWDASAVFPASARQAKQLLTATALLALNACASVGDVGPRMDWRCQGGAAFSVRIKTDDTAEVFAGGQVYRLPHVQAASGARYNNGAVDYWERGGSATLDGARGGPYRNCRR